jgi:hypothetical protein
MENNMLPQKQPQPIAEFHCGDIYKFTIELLAQLRWGNYCQSTCVVVTIVGATRESVM